MLAKKARLRTGLGIDHLADLYWRRKYTVKQISLYLLVTNIRRNLQRELNKTLSLSKI